MTPDSTSEAPIQRALRALAQRDHLGEELSGAVFESVMRGEATAGQTAALLMGLRVKGESAAEVAGAARALRAAMVTVPVQGNHLIDTCGTGGGRVPTFNISTVAALVAAGAGALVAKHGNRSFTSACGSADVFEALGVQIMLDAAAAQRTLREARLVFLFAPNFHPAMRHVGPVRRELAIPSVMNLVGPLANPAGVKRQVLGVADPDRAPVVAEALALLGAEHAFVAHGRAGMDEISPQGITDVWEVRNGTVTRWELDPGIYRLAVADLGALKGGSPDENARRAERLLGGRAEDDPAGYAAVLLNAGAAIYVAGLAASYAEAIGRAREVIGSGAARTALERLRRASLNTSG
jgi:anthranilate phosphoribosyltransferase